MILIIGRFQVRSEQLASFQRLARSLVIEERRVEGCVGFDILQDVAQSDHFVMLEQWQDRAALDHHLASAAYTRNDAALNRFVVGEPDWAEYEV